MILHVLGGMTAGGNERLCLELIRRAPADVPQGLLTIDPRPHGPLTQLFREIPGLRFIHEPYARDRRGRFLIRLVYQLRALKPEGIVIYPFGLHVLVALAAKSVPGCRVIAHVGNPPPPSGDSRSMFRKIVRASRWLNCPLWTCSETVLEQFHTLAVPLPAGSRAQPNGIDVATIRREAADAAAIRTSPGPVIAMVARLDAIKDQLTLLRAFSQVRRTIPAATLLLVGDGDRRGLLEREAHTLGLGTSVTFAGVRRDVSTLLGQADLFAFSTTRAEGFGIALAEAMAVGLPIVASDVPACREVLADGQAGVLVEVGNAEAMSNAIISLLGNLEERRRIGTAATKRAEQAYDINRCAREYYRHLLGREYRFQP